MHVIDSHTGGEPTRVILSGGPDLGAGTIEEQAQVLARDRRDFLNAVLAEPRGQPAMVGALLVPPTSPGSVTGVIYFDLAAVIGMCGHGTIGLGVTLAHMGKIGPGAHNHRYARGQRRHRAFGRKLRARAEHRKPPDFTSVSCRCAGLWPCDRRCRLWRKLVLHHRSQPYCGRDKEPPRDDRSRRCHPRGNQRSASAWAGRSADRPRDLSARCARPKRPQPQLCALPRRQLRPIPMRHRQFRALGVFGSSRNAGAGENHHPRKRHRQSV